VDFGETDLYIQELNAKKWAGFTDWRTPTLEEAMSLMTPAKQGACYLASEFDGAPMLWTSDQHTTAGKAWIVYFYDGRCCGESVNYTGYVRAVRPAQRDMRSKGT
jgi:hypothetical protein